MAVQLNDDFIILGPTITSGRKVLEAVHALYYLPENFKLILTGRETADPSFVQDVLSLAERDGVAHRLRFEGDVENVHAIILPNTGLTRHRNSIAGDSPEAVASAILNMARSSS